MTHTSRFAALAALGSLLLFVAIYAVFPFYPKLGALLTAPSLMLIGAGIWELVMWFIPSLNRDQ